VPGDSQRTRETPGPSGSGAGRPGLAGFLALTLALASLEAAAQTVTGLTATPGGFSAFPSMAPGTAWPTVGSAIPALWTPSGPVTAPGPAGPILPPFLVTGAIAAAQGYNTNVTQTSTGAAKGDTFTQGQLDLGIHYDSLKLKLDAHSSTNAYYFYNEHDANQFNQNLNLTANSELIPNHLFLNLNAYAAPVTLSRVGQISATPGLQVGSNTQQSYGYFVNPVYKTHFGDYVTSQTSFSESQLFFSQPTTVSTDPTVPVVPLANNSTSSTISQGFSSGPYFGRLKWNMTAAYSKADQTGQSQQETLGILSGAYAVNRWFSLLGAFGYDQITTSFPLTQELPPLVAMGGGRFTFGPNFLLAFGAGVSHGFPTYLGSLNWNVTGTFQIVGSLTQSISSSQGNILNGLSTLAVSAEGAFSTSQSYFWQSPQQAINPTFATVSPVPIGGLAFTNGLARNSQANLSFIHSDQRNTYQLSLFGSLQNQLSSPIPTTQNCLIDPTQASCLTVQPNSNSSVYGAQVSASRQMRRNLTGSVGASYSLANEFNGNDRIFTASAGLNYSLSPQTSTYVSANYVQRQSQNQAALLSNGQVLPVGSYSDASIIVGLRYTLGSPPRP
jgi:uncharacterized protein (PEP-CTERM system associated)